MFAIRRSSDIAALLLRLGLAFVFLYAAYSTLRSPLEWTGYLPQFLVRVFSPMLLLRVLAVYEITLAVWLLSGKYLRCAAGLSALTLAGITVTNLAQFVITFRDVGLLCASLALVFLDKDSLNK